MSDDQKLRDRLKRAYPANSKDPVPDEMLEILRRRERSTETKEPYQPPSGSRKKGSSTFLAFVFLTELA